MSRVVIVGAGISGLATAFRLQQRLPNSEITVLEANARPGGTIWTERRDGFQFEVGANGFLDNQPRTVNLCARLGLAQELIPAAEVARHRYLFLNDRLHLLPEGLWSFLRTPLLNWRSKLALLTERWRRPRAEESDESVHDFIRRRTTREVAEVFGDALVTGIHAGDPKLLSMKAAFPRIAEWERRHGSVRAGMAQAARERRALAEARGEPYRRGGRLLGFRDGLRVLIETLCRRLARPPLLGVRVGRIERTAPDAWLVQGEGDRAWPADAVVLACPAPRQAEMLRHFDPTLAQTIGEIAYSPAVVVALGYRREDVPIRLEGFGYIAPQRTRRDVLGLLWCSSIFPNRAPDGRVLLRAIAGGWHRGDVLSWDDGTLLRAVRRELRAAMQVEAAPVFHEIVRWPQAIPQYHVGHTERVRRIESLAATHAGLFLTGNAYHGVALNDCTEQAERVGEQVSRFLAGGPARPA